MKKLVMLAAAAMIWAGCGQSGGDSLGSASDSQTGADRSAASSGENAEATAQARGGIPSSAATNSTAETTSPNSAQPAPAPSGTP